jgi:outer membrane immunogenic protein
MKKLALTLTILTAFCALACAGPEAYSGKDMKQVVPVPPSCPNWGGFYVGGFAGYKFGSIDVHPDLTGLWDAIYPEGRDVVQPRASEDLDTSGFEAGGLIGYNFQWRNWVFGVEAAGGYLWLDNSHQTEVFNIPPPFIDSYDVATSFRSHYLFTFGPRIGYALCRWLPFVTGGLAVGDLDFFQRIHDDTVVFNEEGSATETNLGWMIGGGLEYAITDHWRVRGQYQYLDLGSVDFNSAGNAPYTGYTVHHEASLKEHNASFALIYGF